MKYLFLVLIMGIWSLVSTQNIDHWETIIYNSDEWSYAIGSNDIPREWIGNEYDDTSWDKGLGGFGYGDDDDNTFLDNVLSVFIRKEFEVQDASLIAALLLHADYDDGFVAYLNGVEVARKNLGIAGVRVAYDESALEPTEPRAIYNLLPAAININLTNLRIGKNVLAIQIHNYGQNSSDLTSNFYLSAAIRDTTTIYRDTPSWFDLSVFDSNLPIIKISTAINQNIENEPKIMAHMGIINQSLGLNNSQIHPFNNYDGAIAIEIRGASSRQFEKKGYGLETRKDDGSNNNVELLGLPEENDWALHGPYSDKSLLRNVLSYHLGEQTGRYAPRTRLCELFLDDNYQGVYVLTEKIKQDKNRVDISKLTLDDNDGDELTGGYIIQVDRENGRGWESNFPDNKYFRYVDPQWDVINDAQKNYIQSYMDDFELAMFRDDYEEHYLDYIDVESFVDYFLVTEIGKHIDAFKLSFYLYKDKDSEGGKLHFGPLWDFNLGYGNFDFACSPDPSGWSYEFPDCGSWHPFWARRLAEIPNVRHLINCRWKELREGPFMYTNIKSFLDEKVNEMGTAVGRNFERWTVLGEYLWPNDFIGETYNDELDFLNRWISTRLNWMDENMVGDCNQYISALDEKETYALNLYPNPNDGIFQVSIPLNETATLAAYNLQNQLVHTQEIGAAQNTKVNLSHLTKGLYQVVVKSMKTEAIILSEKVSIMQ